MADCLIRLQSFEEAEKILAELEREKNINETERAKILFLRGLAYEKSEGAFIKNSDLITLASVYPASPVNKSAAAYKTIDCYNLFAAGESDSAEAQILYLAKKYPEFVHYFGRVHVEILADYIIHGKWKEAKEAIKIIKKLYKKDEEIVYKANSLIARGHLGRREKYKATDVLNQCVGSMQASVAMWNAWMILGEVYEYDHSYKDAFMIYKKVFDECPRTLPVCWMARVRMGELATLAQSNENPETIYKYVLKEPHVFEEPRLIAQLYSGQIKPEEFIKQWMLMNPQSSFYLYYLARKAIMDEENRDAHRFLGIMKRLSSHFSWEYVRASRMIDDLYAMGGLK